MSNTCQTCAGYALERQYLCKEAINEIFVSVQIISYLGASDKPLKNWRTLPLSIIRLGLQIFVRELVIACICTSNLAIFEKTYELKSENIVHDFIVQTQSTFIR